MAKYKLLARPIGDSRVPMDIGVGGEFYTDDASDLVAIGAAEEVSEKSEPKTKAEAPPETAPASKTKAEAPPKPAAGGTRGK